MLKEVLPCGQSFDPAEKWDSGNVDAGDKQLNAHRRSSEVGVSQTTTMEPSTLLSLPAEIRTEILERVR